MAGMTIQTDPVRCPLCDETLGVHVAEQNVDEGNVTVRLALDEHACWVLVEAHRQMTTEPEPLPEGHIDLGPGNDGLIRREPPQPRPIRAG